VLALLSWCRFELVVSLEVDLTRLVIAAIAVAALGVVAAQAHRQHSVGPPAPIGPIPSARQLAWHDLEFYGFLHFGINTFTDKEWGYGDESESLFDPSSLDARQWARVARDAGMKGLIITAKHHDGFCLWPSRFTSHSVKRSRWKEGHGDVLRELAVACREYGLKLGVYLSPWDRNQPSYGTPGYLDYYRAQLRELLNNYGPLFEVWFDGANGGDGYYGGARDTRRIDARNDYEWPVTWSLVRQLQPGAVMFSDAGPDARWVGNEKGVAFETSWYGLDRGMTYPGDQAYSREFARGRADATDWVPPEVDVSIRPGWFYHQVEDGKVKSVDELMTIYEQSVGRGANLLLNVPPDKSGRISDIDAERLRSFRKVLDAVYANDLARSATATATNVRGGLPIYDPARVNDGRPDTYWAADDGVTSASVTLAFPKPATFERVVMQEFIALGQRVERWSVDAEVDGSWRVVAEGTTIGRKRIARCAPFTTSRIRINILSARACPTLASVGVY
jgi:alpha-L-fucosidase